VTTSKSNHELPAEPISVGPGDAQILREIVALGDKSRRTLGFLPGAAFVQASENGTLLAVIRDGRVAAYALYSLPRQIVRLTHLCVDEDLRGHGLARLLVQAISRRHADRFGIVLKCRKDYHENTFWPRLGFQAVNEIAGRSKMRHPLVVWRLDHGHPDLFSASDSVGILRVAIDLNVFLDLESSYHRDNALESQALAEDWLADQVELVVTGELETELARLPTGPEKDRQSRAARKYWHLPSDNKAVSATAQRIVEHVARVQHLDLTTDAADISDVRHVASAYLAGITVLATRDDRLLRWSTEAAEVCGIRVLRPSEVILHVDELSRAQAYRPVQLHDTGYNLAPVRQGDEAELLKFLNTSDAEQKSEYLARTRRLGAEGRKWNRLVLRSPQGEPTAFYVTGISESELVIPVFRVRAPRLEETLARQLLYLARMEAKLENRSVIRITDPRLSRNIETVIKLNGFLRDEGSWVGLAIKACADAATIEEITTASALVTNIRLQPLLPGLSAVIAAELERTLWPVKVVDSELPTFLVPIRPVWASELFGTPQMLTPRSDLLGLSREHVYYRSPIPRVERAPARLVWYVTESGSGGLGAVIGCSRLDEIVIDKPAALHERFRHLGVWQKDQIVRSARDGKALALKFADTEIFARQVSLSRLRHLASMHRQPLSLRSPQKIPAELFAAIYREGQPSE
jgi:GNAT superfamily N-acetyltransferase